MNITKTADKLINNVTMYRLLVYGLGVLLAAAIGLSLLGKLGLSAGGIALSVLVLVITCKLANYALATLWNAPSNCESWLITALILACILPPTTNLHGLALIALGGLIAMVSKYVLVLHHKHIFNPAAFAAIVLGLSRLLPATWWIGSSIMLPLTAIFGLIVLRKVRRFQLFFSFLAASLAAAVVFGLIHHSPLGSMLIIAIRSSPLVFLGTVMLTEPETMAPRIMQQRIYGLIVGGLFMSQFHFGILSATPELALIIGNIYSYLVSPKRKLSLRLKSRTQLAPGLYDFAFAGAPDKPPLDFQPGQYLEWTLDGVPFDRRGTRRTFSLAGAPADTEQHIGIKTYQPGSKFKQALMAMKPGDPIVAGQLAGNFILPKSTKQKLVFVAGGIGITPFVSMAKDMIAHKQSRDIVLFYMVNDPAELCYGDIWSVVREYGLRLVPFAANGTTLPANWHGYGHTGRITPEIIKQEVPDYKQRRYYLSGPNALVEAYGSLLHKLGVKRSAIVTDHFSGY